jgi:hypothetical protein
MSSNLQLFRPDTITFSIPENGASLDLPPAISIRQVGFCKRCHTRPQFCFDPALDGFFAMWCQCCVVTGPLPDFIRPDNSEDWTRLVLDEVDAANGLKTNGTFMSRRMNDLNKDRNLCRLD